MKNQETFLNRCESACCRSCDRVGLHPVVDLGMMPPSDRILTRNQLNEKERKFPLDVGFCPDCTLVQILETVPPDFLFGEDYMYFSSFSQEWIDHCRSNALDLIERRKLGPESLVVELASNDGYLLKNFVEKGVPVLGIDPAPMQAAEAEKVGVHTLIDFFTRELAEQLKSEGVRADVMIGNNVLAHVADTNGFVAGIAALLNRNMVVVSIQEKVAKKGKTAGGSVALADLVVFTRQLATMIDAGLAMVQSLQGLAEQTTNKVMRDVIKDVCSRVEGGDSFSEALRMGSEIFHALRKQLKDAQSRDGFDFPVEYMFKHVPKELYGKSNPIDITLHEMDKYGIERGLIGVGGDHRIEPIPNVHVGRVR